MIYSVNLLRYSRKSQIKHLPKLSFGPTSIFDPRKLPEYLPTLGAYGCVELDKLLEHYGSRKSS